MSNLDVIRAWKDQEYRLSLSEPQLARLPANPAGLVELSDDRSSEQAFPTLYTCVLCPQTLIDSCITVCPTIVGSCITVCPVDELDPERFGPAN